MGHGFGYFLLTASDDGVSFIAAAEPVTEWRQLDKQERERRVTKLRAHPFDQLFHHPVVYIWVRGVGFSLIPKNSLYGERSNRLQHGVIQTGRAVHMIRSHGNNRIILVLHHPYFLFCFGKPVHDGTPFHGVMIRVFEFPALLTFLPQFPGRVMGGFLLIIAVPHIQRFVREIFFTHPGTGRRTAPVAADHTHRDVPDGGCRNGIRHMCFGISICFRCKGGGKIFPQFPGEVVSGC